MFRLISVLRSFCFPHILKRDALFARPLLVPCLSGGSRILPSLDAVLHHLCWSYVKLTELAVSYSCFMAYSHPLRTHLQTVFAPVPFYVANTVRTILESYVTCSMSASQGTATGILNGKGSNSLILPSQSRTVSANERIALRCGYFLCYSGALTLYRYRK